MKKNIVHILFLLNIFLLCNNSLFAQTTVTGVVISSDDQQPLIGVTVAVKGKTQGTQTDAEGRFSLNASSTDVLVFTYVSFAPQEIKVGPQTNLKVIMTPDIASLNEVVVVGYGTQSRTSITGSIAKLDTEVLANTPRSNVATALQGTVPGLQVVNKTGQPGAAPMLQLRGGASINNPGGPLVIVDGVIRDLNDISSENIASIELLKDASATAIYGARANNGVVLVTTKTGKEGSAQISYKYTAGFNQRREGYKYMNAGDFIHYTRLGYLNSGRTSAQVNSARGLGLLTDAANLATFDIRRYSADLDYLLNEGWDVVDDPYGGQIIYKDHGGEVEDLLFRTTHTQDHYVNVMGGNDRGKYFASFDAYDEDGVIVGSNYKRYSADVNGSYKLRSNLEVSTGVTLSTASQTGVMGSEINALYRNMAVWPTFNPWIDEAKTLPNPGGGVNDGNPLYWLGRLDRSSETNRVIVNGSLKWDIIPGLYFQATGNAFYWKG